ncbi:hypothetical protein EVAR_89842_1 [Eumeta japonica]|uniref:Uncharacterized protein n=1 Tax=Eumeta variegata TaxID=151549 RepID=A0A4C1ZWN7_EUMVA|nr:hypothetical protein EVAR_89842_1 [Eumeta japonica]
MAPENTSEVTVPESPPRRSGLSAARQRQSLGRAPRPFGMTSKVEAPNTIATPSSVATAIRYVKDGVVNESLLMVKTTENLDAATFTELTLNTLTENNIDPLVCLANAMMAFNGDDVAKSIGIKKSCLIWNPNSHGCGQKSYPRYNLQTQLCKPEAQD